MGKTCQRETATDGTAQSAKHKSKTNSRNMSPPSFCTKEPLQTAWQAVCAHSPGALGTWVSFMIFDTQHIGPKAFHSKDHYNRQVQSFTPYRSSGYKDDGSVQRHSALGVIHTVCDTCLWKVLPAEFTVTTVTLSWLARRP